MVAELDPSSNLSLMPTWVGVCFVYMKPDSTVGTSNEYKHNCEFPRNFTDFLLASLENIWDAQ